MYFKEIQYKFYFKFISCGNNLERVLRSISLVKCRDSMFVTYWVSISIHLIIMDINFMRSCHGLRWPHLTCSSVNSSIELIVFHFTICSVIANFALFLSHTWSHGIRRMNDLKIVLEIFSTHCSDSVISIYSSAAVTFWNYLFNIWLIKLKYF